MADEARLPGVETGADADPIVLHVDADCFYAACERLREPELRGEPLVVGMGYELGDSVGAVATASYEAREFGVESAMAISEALEKLPRRAAAESDPDEGGSETGRYRPVDMAYYESVSEDVRSILQESADVVREVSIDEAYLDVTERTDWSVVEGFARHVKERIDREVGVTVSIGVAPSMSAAKIASDHDKPDGLTVVEPGEVREFLAPLDVSEIHGVGPVTARSLREMGLETAADVAAADPGALVDAFGERGRELYDYARGDDDRKVTPRGLPKSFSRESAFGSPVTDWERKRETLETLAEAVADRATREGALYRTVGVKAVTPPYDVNTRERSLSGPVDDPALVVEIATDLFREFAEDRVRKLGVRVANLEFGAADQSKLDGWATTDRSNGDADHPSPRGTGRDSDDDGRIPDAIEYGSDDKGQVSDAVGQESDDGNQIPGAVEHGSDDGGTEPDAVGSSSERPRETADDESNAGQRTLDESVGRATVTDPGSTFDRLGFEAADVGSRSTDDPVLDDRPTREAAVDLSDFESSESGSESDREHVGPHRSAVDDRRGPTDPAQTTLPDFVDD